MAKQTKPQYALTRHQLMLRQHNIYHGLPLTWQERKLQEAKDRFYRKLANYCFAVEMVIIVSILWLVVPQLIERAL